MTVLRYWPDPSAKPIPKGWVYFGPLLNARGKSSHHARYSCLIAKVSR